MTLRQIFFAAIFAMCCVEAVFSGGPTVSKHVAVVLPETFCDTLEPWIRYRSAQGYRVHVITPKMPLPDRVKEISDRIHNLAGRVPLSAVLLVGDAATVPAPRIPCRIIQHFGEETELASDDRYADLDDDGVPDLAVGRFPAESAHDLERMVRKTIRYETEILPGLWSRRIQVVAGMGNFSPLLDGVIESSIRHAISETVPPAWDLAFLHADWQSAFCPSLHDFREELAETLNRAPLFWAWFGHGHHRMLDPLATSLGTVPTLCADEMPRFRCQDNLSIAFLFCCYGGFLDRETPSLAEELLRQTEGPVAVVAASRTTMPYGMSVFGVELFGAVLRSGTKPARPELGTLLLETKRRMLVSPEEKPANPGGPGRQRGGVRSGVRHNLEIMAKSFDPSAARLPEQLEEHAAMFHLFGDPLLAVPLPGTIQLECPQRVRAGSTVTVEGVLEDVEAQTVTVELLPALDRLSLRSPHRTAPDAGPERRLADNEEYRKSNDRIVMTTTVSVTEGKFQAEFTVPDHVKGRYVLRAFSATSSDCTIGYAEISIRSTSRTRSAAELPGGPGAKP